MRIRFRVRSARQRRTSNGTCKRAPVFAVYSGYADVDAPQSSHARRPVRYDAAKAPCKDVNGGLGLSPYTLLCRFDLWRRLRYDKSVTDSTP